MARLIKLNRLIGAEQSLYERHLDTNAFNIGIHILPTLRYRFF